MPFLETDREAQVTRRELDIKLQEAGWTNGRTARIEYRFAPNATDGLQTSAVELVNFKPDVIVARTTPAAAAVQRLTSNIPIVFVGVADPIGSKFINSLSRPGGNMTGFTNFEPGMAGKWLEILKEAAPSIARAAFLSNRHTAPYAEHYLKSFEAAAASLSIEPITAYTENAGAIETAINAIGSERDSGLIVMPDTFTTNFGDLILALTARHSVPAIFPFRYFTARGGLISYGVDTTDQIRRVPAYVDRILKGEKPADLPVQAPTKFELVVNLKTAKALKLNIPPILLARADEVIE